MHKGIKIFIGVMVFFGILSGIFLLTAKRKPIARTVIKSEQNVAEKNKPIATPQEKKQIMRSQWQQCKNKTLPVSVELFWTIKISEAIPVGGVYGSGLLDGDQTFPVRFFLKPGISNADIIKSEILAGKAATLRGNCIDMAVDGSAVFQLF